MLEYCCQFERYITGAVLSHPTLVNSSISLMPEQLMVVTLRSEQIVYLPRQTLFQHVCHTALTAFQAKFKNIIHKLKNTIVHRNQSHQENIKCYINPSVSVNNWLASLPKQWIHPDQAPDLVQRVNSPHQSLHTSSAIEDVTAVRVSCKRLVVVKIHLNYAKIIDTANEAVSVSFHERTFQEARALGAHFFIRVHSLSTCLRDAPTR